MKIRRPRRVEPLAGILGGDGWRRFVGTESRYCDVAAMTNQIFPGHRTVQTGRISAVAAFVFSMVGLVALATPTSGDASPLHLPDCSNLIVGAGSSEAAAGSAWIDVLVVNGGRQCSISGFPGVELFDRHGKLIDQDDRHSGVGEFANQKPKRVILDHGQVASFGVMWNDNPVGSQRCPMAAWAVIRVPGVTKSNGPSVGVDIAPCGGAVTVTPIELGAVPVKR